MTIALERAGIFRAKPVSWSVRPAKETASIAIGIEYSIVAQLDGHDWIDWTAYDEHRVSGYHYVVKKDGKPNVNTVQQLAAAIGWGGSLKQVVNGPPPDCIVQITVKENTYNGKTTYRAEWVNPENYVPTGGGADEQEVDQLQARFGSLLQAAASSRPKPPSGGAPAAKPAPPKSAPAPAASEPPTAYGEIPF